MIPAGLHSGKIIGLDPSKKTYRVMIDGYADKEATLLETGISMAIPMDAKVGCIWSESDGWKILGIISVPYRRPQGKPDLTATADDDLAGMEAKLTSKVVDDDRSSLLTYRDPEDLNPANLQDEVSLNNKFASTFVRLFNDGSILGQSSRILFWMFNQVKKTFILHTTKILMRAQGLDFRHGVKDKGRTVSQAGPTTPKISTDLNYSYNPDDIKDFDFVMDAGEIQKSKEPQPTYAVSDYIKAAQDVGRASTDSEAGTSNSSSALTRGLRLILRKLGILEIDLWKNELRLSSLSGTPPAQARQLRMNDDEISIEWDQNIMAMDKDGFSVKDLAGNFFSFKNGEFFVKATKIGFAGPLALWDYAEASSFAKTDGYPDLNRVGLEWKASGASGPGLYFNQDVYFGTAAQPAILKGLYDQHYSQVWNALAGHFHSTSSPGAPTGPMTAPLVDALNAATLNVTAVTDLWFSLMQVSV